MIESVRHIREGFEHLMMATFLVPRFGEMSNQNFNSVSYYVCIIYVCNSV